MVTHIILLKIRADIPPSRVDEAFGALADLRTKIPGLLSFAGGAYSSDEGLHKGFTHGFVMTFADAAARDAYLPHPAHEDVKAQLLPLLEGGLEGVVAFDFVN